MKKFISVILALCLACPALVLASAADTDTVIDGGWSVLLQADCAENERYAAEILASKLSQVFGCEIPITASAAGKYIAVNAPEGIYPDAANGYIIKADADKVYISGTGSRGMIHGAYRFLEEFCGHKVYTSTLTVLPEAQNVIVPAGTFITYAPFFEYTDTDWRSPRDPQYSLANGLNGGPYRTLASYQGGTVNYLGGLCHTFTGTFCSKNKYYDEHPEYFALRDGKRDSSQLCLTNPDVQKIVTEEVLALLAAQHDPSASLQIVSLTQADNYNYCQCENCAAFEKAHGDVRSATMINFVNGVADVVKAAGYDNVAIDTFAYQYTRQAPTGIVPRDNVIVRLCTIECCFCHALDDPSCERNTALMKDLSDWSKICGRIYVWDYTTNYAHTCCVFPDFGVIQKNIQIFYEHNVKGVYEEGNYYIDSVDAEFGELRSYMLSKCLQDPYCALDREVDGFLEAFYGAGWENVRKALDLYTEHAGSKKGHLSIYEGSADSMVMNNYTIGRIDQYWNAAKAEAQTDAQRKNVERSELSWRYWKASVKKSEFSLWNPGRFTEKEKLFEDFKAFGIRTLSEGQEVGDYMDCYSPKFAIPDEWYMYEADESGAKTINFFGGILEKLLPLLTGFGTVYKIMKAIFSSGFGENVC